MFIYRCNSCTQRFTDFEDVNHDLICPHCGSDAHEIIEETYEIDLCDI